MRSWNCNFNLCNHHVLHRPANGSAAVLPLVGLLALANIPCSTLHHSRYAYVCIVPRGQSRRCRSTGVRSKCVSAFILRRLATLLYELVQLRVGFLHKHHQPDSPLNTVDHGDV